MVEISFRKSTVICDDSNSGFFIENSHNLPEPPNAILSRNGVSLGTAGDGLMCTTGKSDRAKLNRTSPAKMDSFVERSLIVMVSTSTSSTKRRLVVVI